MSRYPPHVIEPYVAQPRVRRASTRDYIVPTEHQEQAALIAWTRLPVVVAAHPEVELLYAIPNGGWRFRTTAERLKAEGVKSGVPDLCLPVPRGGYSALYVEMKSRTGRVSAEQRGWIEALRGAGNMVAVCRGFQEAQAVILDYLSNGGSNG